VYEESIANGGRSPELPGLDRRRAPPGPGQRADGQGGRYTCFQYETASPGAGWFFCAMLPSNPVTWPKTGALIYKAVNPGKLWSMYLAPLDSASRPGAWRKLEANLQNINNPWPDWSPESSQIVYGSTDPEVGQAGNAVIRILNLSTGEDREIYRMAKGSCAWAVRSEKIVCANSEQASSEFRCDLARLGRTATPGRRAWNQDLGSPSEPRR